MRYRSLTILDFSPPVRWSLNISLRSAILSSQLQPGPEHLFRLHLLATSRRSCWSWMILEWRAAPIISSSSTGSLAPRAVRSASIETSLIEKASRRAHNKGPSTRIAHATVNSSMMRNHGGNIASNNSGPNRMIPFYNMVSDTSGLLSQYQFEAQGPRYRMLAWLALQGYPEGRRRPQQGAGQLLPISYIVSVKRIWGCRPNCRHCCYVSFWSSGSSISLTCLDIWSVLLPIHRGPNGGCILLGSSLLGNTDPGRKGWGQLDL